MPGEQEVAPPGRRTWFGRYPRIALALWSGLVVLGIDVAAGMAYRRITGHSFLERPQVVALQRESAAYRTPSTIYSHDLRPNVSRHDAVWGPRRYVVSTNSLGFKDRAARTVPLRGSQPRVLFIGDSFTEGLGVPYEDTFVGVIGDRLGDAGIEVLNAAVMSYSPLIYWRKLKHWIEDRGLHVDHVVVYIDLSDADDEASVYRLDGDGNVHHTEAVADGMLRERRQGAAGGRGVSGFLKHNTVVAATLVAIKHRLFPYEPSPLNQHRALWTFHDSTYALYGEHGERRMTAHMDSLHGLLSRRGIGLTVAVYPWPDQIATGDLDSRQVRLWQEWSAQRDVDFVNHFPQLVRGTTEAERMAVIDRYYIAGDVHWNEVGHRLIADGFLDEFDHRRLIVADNANPSLP
jgi:hypothetical protein